MVRSANAKAAMHLDCFFQNMLSAAVAVALSNAGREKGLLKIAIWPVGGICQKSPKRKVFIPPKGRGWDLLICPEGKIGYL